MTGMIRFNFTPVDAPTGSTGRGKCPPTMWKPGTVAFAPYNDYAIIQGGLEFLLFPKPGGNGGLSGSARATNVTIRNTYWRVKMEYLGPR